MKFLSILALVSAALATVSNIALFVKSDSPKMTSLGVRPANKEASLLLSTEEETLVMKYDSEMRIIYASADRGSMPVPLLFTIDGSGVYKLKATMYPLLVTIADTGKLEFEGDGDVYAVKNMRDGDGDIECNCLVNFVVDGSGPVELYAKFTPQYEPRGSITDQAVTLVKLALRKLLQVMLTY
ncbi:Cell wall protein RHD3 [Candida viswanathii]|uniref:Cell wall protein RHD3 n=1 Tax=Candida viswanathii TaxID=5486 RepID=A0A367Y9F9_9ASCO|nr:Cell wall protein RHD3 [Candida viswanathii]